SERLPPQPMAPDRALFGKIRQTERAARSLKESPPMRFCGLPRFSQFRSVGPLRQRPAAIRARRKGKEKGDVPAGTPPLFVLRFADLVVVVKGELVGVRAE